MAKPNTRFTNEIISRNLERENGLRANARKSSQATRRRPERISDARNLRMAFAHDADRIIHSMAYSRYLGKTQVFFQVGNDHITRRALHVQLVSKIARTIARFLNANEDLTEAISLAHDIGHTPFGHPGESALAACMEECKKGSFLHSAQSVRVLDKIEKRRKGLNLTLEVLDGILGHNGENLSNQIKFNPKNLNFERLDYDTEKCLTLPRKVGYEKSVFPSTLEGCIVRVSDTIAYLGRDIDDAIRLGLIKREQLPQNAVSILGAQNSDIVNSLCIDVMNNSYDGKAIRFSDKVYSAVLQLKKFSVENIYYHPLITAQVSRFIPMLKAMFKKLVKDLKEKNTQSIIFGAFISQSSEAYLNENAPERIVADFISAMTDDYFMETYNKMFMPERIDYGRKFERF